MNAPVQTHAGIQLIEVPCALNTRLDAVVAKTARRLGENEASCRRAVELALIQRGLDALEGDSK